MESTEKYKWYYLAYYEVVTHGDVYLRCKNDPVGASNFKELPANDYVVFNDFIVLTIAFLNHPIYTTTYEIGAVRPSATIWLYKARI